MGWMIQGSNPSRGKFFFFSSPKHPTWLWGPPNLLLNRYWQYFFPGVKQPGREDDRSPPFIDKVKNGRVYTSSLLLCLHGAQLYFHLSLVFTLIKLNVFNNNVNNSIKMGKQKHMETCSILCFLIYQSLLQHSN